MWFVGAILVVTIVATTTSRGLTACEDPQEVADARTEIDSTCPCAAASRSDYLRCARRVLRNRTNRGELPASCRAAVRRCASTSTCGRPGRVTCCLPGSAGVTCRVRGDAASCTARGGVVGTCASCCDACGGSCTTSTTTTIPFCGGPGDSQCTGSCGLNGTCSNADGSCMCTYNNCSGGVFPECDGACPPDSACVNVGSSCECGLNQCSGGTYPECNGGCLSESTCFNQGISCVCVPDVCSGEVCGCVQEWPFLCGSSDDCLPGRTCVLCPHGSFHFCTSGSCETIVDCLPGDFCADLGVCEFP